MRKLLHEARHAGNRCRRSKPLCRAVQMPERPQQIEELFLQGIEVGPEDNEPGFKCQSATVKWATSEQIQKWLDKST